jgi:hypothetical protein
MEWWRGDTGWCAAGHALDTAPADVGVVHVSAEGSGSWALFGWAVAGQALAIKVGGEGDLRCQRSLLAGQS